MVDRFPRLRHDAVVGGHHQHHDVGHLGAAGAHHGERRVAGRIEEDNLLAGFLAGAHQVSADVLRDAAGFALGHAGSANRVEERRLAVVDVAHDGDHGPAGDEVFGVGGLVALFDDFLLEAAGVDLGAEAGGQHLGRVEIDGRVDGHHQTAVQQGLERVLDADLKAVRQVLDRHAFREGDGTGDRWQRRDWRRRLRARGITAL